MKLITRTTALVVIGGALSFPLPAIADYNDYFAGHFVQITNEELAIDQLRRAYGLHALLPYRLAEQMDMTIGWENTDQAAEDRRQMEILNRARTRIKLEHDLKHRASTPGYQTLSDAAADAIILERAAKARELLALMQSNCNVQFGVTEPLSLGDESDILLAHNKLYHGGGGAGSPPVPRGAPLLEPWPHQRESMLELVVGNSWSRDSTGLISPNGQATSEGAKKAVTTGLATLGPDSSSPTKNPSHMLCQPKLC